MAETMKVGVIGGGQLGRMLALAGTPLGMQFIFIDPAGDACARHVGQLIRADYNDHYELRTLVNAAEALLKAGAKEVSAYITHGVLSEGAAQRIGKSKLKELVVTDSIEETEAHRAAGNIRRMSIAPLIGEAVARTASEQSVSSLFD